MKHSNNRTRSYGNNIDYGYINRGHNYKNHKTRNYGNEYHGTVKEYIFAFLTVIFICWAVCIAGHWDYMDEFPEEYTEINEENYGIFTYLLK